jgi:hypothetical protein
MLITTLSPELLHEHHTWHTRIGEVGGRSVAMGQPGAGEEFLKWHRYFTRKVLASLAGTIPAAQTVRWASIPAELKAWDWTDELAEAESRLTRPWSFGSLDAFGTFIETGIHAWLHAASAATFSEPIVGEIHSAPSSTYFYQLHGLIDYWFERFLNGEFYTTDGSGSISRISDGRLYRGSWSRILPGSFESRKLDGLLFYDRQRGEGEIYGNDGSTTLKLLAAHRWRTSWDVIVPGRFSNSTYTDLLFYDRAKGQGEFYASDGRGNISFLSAHNWRKTWSAIVPGNFGGSGLTDLLFYDSGRGEGEIYSCDPTRKLTLLQSHSWRKSWNLIVPGNFGGTSWTDLLFYDRAKGDGEIYTSDGHGNISLLRKHSWRKSWHTIAAGSFGGNSRTDLLFYDSTNKQGELYSTDGLGNLTLLKKHNWRESWDLVVPGNFTNDTLSDILFYSRYPK